MFQFCACGLVNTGSVKLKLFLKKCFGHQVTDHQKPLLSEPPDDLLQVSVIGLDNVHKSLSISSAGK